MDEPEMTPGGSEVFRHDAPGDLPAGPPAHAALEAIEAHVERHVGPVETVFHEIVSARVHIDVLVVPGHGDRPWHTLVTCGMSALPMTVPDGAESSPLAELVIGLPPEWPLDPEAWKDERHFWPVRLIKTLAGLPHEFDTYLGVGHTVPNGDPPEPYAGGTELCGALVAPLLMTPAGLGELELPEGSISFFGVVALHRDEMDLKLREGWHALAEPFDRAHVSEVVEADRPSALRRRRRFGLF